MNTKRQTGTSAAGILYFMACLAFAVILFLFVDRTLKATSAYRLGSELAKNDPAMIELFGSPIEQSFWVMGKAKKYQDGSDSANLQTFISGPKAHGMLYIHGKGKDNACQMLSMYVRISGRIVLSYNSAWSEKGFQTYTPVP